MSDWREKRPPIFLFWSVSTKKRGRPHVKGLLKYD